MPYEKLSIQTSSKVREVYNPSARVRDIQRMLLTTVWSGIDPGEHSAAYEQGMKLIDSGIKLQKHGLIVGLDFKNFFHSIPRKLIKQLLLEYGYPDITANVVATLSCVRDNQRHFLPQGGISSAQIANRIAAKYIDPLVIEYCALYGDTTYVRYSDNIYVGLDKKTSGKEFVLGLSKILYDNRWRTHKARVMPYYKSQKLLGMVVNEKANAPRQEYHKFIAALFNIGRTTSEAELLTEVSKLDGIGIQTSCGKGILLMSLIGKANYYLTLVNSHRGTKLQQNLAKAKDSIERFYK